VLLYFLRVVALKILSDCTMIVPVHCSDWQCNYFTIPDYVDTTETLPHKMPVCQFFKCV